MGCEFWSIQVTEDLNGDGRGMGINVGTPWLDKDAHIRIEDMRGAGQSLRTVTEFHLSAKENKFNYINGKDGILADQHHRIGNGMNAFGAFRITSDVPVNAMQIDPVGGYEAWYPDASLLLPSSAAEPTYMGINYQAGGWVSVVAIENDTVVTTTGGDVMLDAFDVYRYTGGGDMTGFYLTANKPVVAFSGHECANVPTGMPFCDHLQEQLIPLASWGTTYVGARHPPRLHELVEEPELVYWRVVAGVEDQEIELQPAQTGVGDTISLTNVGEFQEFSSDHSFVASSEDPFMLVQFMAGGKIIDGPNVVPSSATGDPYMAQTAPVEQWLTQLAFLTDEDHELDFVVMSREAETSVDLECLGELSDDDFTPIDGTNYEVGFVELDKHVMGPEVECAYSQQFITASEPVGVLVGGYDSWSSYGLVGGLNLDLLWDPPSEPPG
jgi:hypothetical protein